MSHLPTVMSPPHSALDDVLCQMGQAGARICEIEAAEAGAGNISVLTAGTPDLPRYFGQSEPIELPGTYPALAGRTVLATGSGRRLRQISDDPLSAVGAIEINPDGRTATLHTSTARKFTRLTSELNSHLGVHDDQVARRGLNFHVVVHAQPPHLTHLSHVPHYRDTARLNRAVATTFGVDSPWA